MKLVRYGNPGKEKPGLIDANGQLRDLSAVVKDIGPEQLGDAGGKIHSSLAPVAWITRAQVSRSARKNAPNSTGVEPSTSIEALDM